MILAAAIGFFAIIHRRIPPKRAGLYVALFFLGAASMAIAHLPGKISPAFNFVFLIFPVASLSAFMDQNSVMEQTSSVFRGFGISQLGVSLYCLMLACYGIRGILLAGKPWRLGVFLVSVVLGMAGGYRTTAFLLLLTFAVLFYLERLHHTRVFLPLILVLFTCGGLITLLAPRLPYQFQRSLAFLPLPLDPMVRYDTQGSTEWRLKMWRDLVPQIPRYLIVGKGYSFSGREAQQISQGGAGAEGAEFVGDYHNGPLSVLVPFGLFGAIAFIWLLVAGLRVLYQNYQFGDPAFHQYNIFLFTFFLAKVISFFLVFGSLYSDLPMILGLLALSISLNGGVAKPAVAPQPKVVFNRFRLRPSIHRPISA
ncbi:MAG TPA: O-antigen ligase family protein [Candidatus Paceibacterota bacterium]|nr:O-antigen ligase family protein [Candidatus Paceibacterota bacterium]